MQWPLPKVKKSIWPHTNYVFNSRGVEGGVDERTGGGGGEWLLLSGVRIEKNPIMCEGII